MNKKVVLAVAVACVLSFVWTVQAAEYKIGYVDMAKIFGEYKKTKDAEKVLEEKSKAKEADRKKLVDEVRKMKDEQALLSDKAKGEKQKAIDDKIKTLQDYDRGARDELLKERNNILGAILKDIEKVISDYSKETGYDIVLDSRTILYATEKFDQTAEVLNRLNK